MNKGNGGRGGCNKRGRDEKRMTRSTVRTKNYTSVLKRYIHCPIAQRLKKIKTMMTKSQKLPLVE